MCQTAANLLALVLPDQPIRQRTVSLPFELRLPVARDSSLLSAVLRIVVSEIDKLYKRFGQERGVRDGATGLVAATQLCRSMPARSSACAWASSATSMSAAWCTSQTPTKRASGRARAAHGPASTRDGTCMRGSSSQRPTPRGASGCADTCSGTR
jgi:hypothetical protein